MNFYKLTKEEKIKRKQERAFRRKAKRIAKDKKYLQIALSHDRLGLSWGRRRSKGRAFICERGFKCCEERGYCNGDC